MKNVLIISQYFPPDITAAAFRMEETRKLLMERGYQVRVITSTPHKARTERSNDAELHAEGVLRVIVRPISGRSVRAYLDQYIGFAWRAFWLALRLRRSFRYDVIWASSPPLFVALTSMFLQLFCRCPAVLDIRDIWPESAIGVGKLRRRSIMERAGVILENAAYRASSGITCVSRPMQRYIAAKTKKEVVVVYNGVLNREEISPPEFLEGQPSKIFCYSGNLGYAQGLDGVISAFAGSLKQPSMASARLLIVGTGALEEELKEQAALLGIADSVRFFGVMSKPEAMKIMASAGTLLIPLVDSRAFEMTVPSKLFDCMSLGRPIIACIRGEGASILAESGGNIVVSPGDSDALATALVTMSNEWQSRSALAKLNQLIIKERYTRDVAVDKLADFLERMIQGAKT